MLLAHEERPLKLIGTYYFKNVHINASTRNYVSKIPIDIGIITQIIPVVT